MSTGRISTKIIIYTSKDTKEKKEILVSDKIPSRGQQVNACEIYNYLKEQEKEQNLNFSLTKVFDYGFHSSTFFYIKNSKNLEKAEQLLRYKFNENNFEYKKQFSLETPDAQQNSPERNKLRG